MADPVLFAVSGLLLLLVVLGGIWVLRYRSRQQEKDQERRESTRQRLRQITREQ